VGHDQVDDHALLLFALDAVHAHVKEALVRVNLALLPAIDPAALKRRTHPPKIVAGLRRINRAGMRRTDQQPSACAVL
jgi:hypothetical protein